MQAGHNQYPPMPGMPQLREAVAAQNCKPCTAATTTPHTEITITAGATQAILTAILATVHAGDEVIVLDPCYDSYAPNIELAGGVIVRVPLTPGSFRPDFAKIAAAITPAHAPDHRRTPRTTPAPPSGPLRKCASSKPCSPPPTCC